MKNIQSKIYTSNALVEKINALKNEGKEIILCHGHFNVIHPGHMRFLNFAKQKGDFLIVSICKQEELDPINRGLFYTQEDRASGVANLEVIDAVIQVNSDIIELINELRPDFYLKGKEFEDRQLSIKEEINAVENIGGRVIFSSGEVKYTTTSFMNDSIGNDHERKLSNFINICLRNNIDLIKIKKSLLEFNKLNILVVGDTIVDQFVACDPLGVSAEAPVIVVKELEEKTFIGGAAIIAQHISSLGAETHFFSILGDDDPSLFVQKELNTHNIQSFLLKDDSRPTTFKIRYVSNNQKLFRVSRLKDHPISKNQEKVFLKNIYEIIPGLDGIIISDFVYGLITPQIIEAIKRAAAKYKVKIFGDTQCSSQVGDVSKFKGIDLITPTEKEARISLSDPSSGLEKLAQSLIDKTNNKNIVITLGEQGLLVYSKTNTKYFSSEFFPALVSDPKDVAGAGDAMLTGFSLGLSLGLTILESAVIASCMSALSVMRIGNISIKSEELTNYIDKLIRYKELNTHTQTNKRKTSDMLLL
ncbi:PfkB family carbohydrate kinase [Bacteriovoracales bacterium]|nr:PfkB family carbohydrate kinase [Bacteriovoracales bacterium]